MEVSRPLYVFSVCYMQSTSLNDFMSSWDSLSVTL